MPHPYDDTATERADDPAHPGLEVCYLGRRDYEAVWRDMQRFTADRDDDTPDNFWAVEHPPIYTLGQAARPEHLLDPGDIPVLRVDRGGQVTYHGPGQLVIYTLVDLQRRRLGVRQLVEALENGVIGLLAHHGIEARGRRDAPGVYVGEAKIAALGLKISRGRSYHGLALNVNMDLEPFGRIDPCGHPGLAVTRLRDLGIDIPLWELAGELCERLHREIYQNTTSNR